MNVEWYCFYKQTFSHCAFIMHSKSKAMNKNWKFEIIPNYSKVFQNMFETEIQSLLYSSCFITLSHIYIFMLTQHQILQPTFKHPLSNPRRNRWRENCPMHPTDWLPPTRNGFDAMLYWSRRPLLPPPPTTLLPQLLQTTRIWNRNRTRKIFHFQKVYNQYVKHYFGNSYVIVIQDPISSKERSIMQYFWWKFADRNYVIEFKLHNIFKYQCTFHL